MKKKDSNLSIRRIILLIFVISLLISVTIYGTLIFTNWVSWAWERTEDIAAHVNQDIYNRVNSFIQEPFYINEINHQIIQKEMLDFSDENQRDLFFVRVLQSNNEEIYSFSYGTISGTPYLHYSL